MISRRTMLAGLLASVTMPRLPLPTRGVCYIVFEDIPLERFAAKLPRMIGHAMHDAAKGEIVNVRLGQ